MQVKSLSGPFGAEVSGLDLAADMSDDLMCDLIGLLHEHQILVIGGQRLSNSDYVRFGYFWGKPLTFTLKSHTHDDYPEIIRIANSASTPERYRDGAMHWHSDSTYEDVPASVTMLYGVESPNTGGATRIASTALAYDALPEATKQRIDGLIGLHCLGGSPSLPGENIPFVPEETARHGIKKHNLVMRHPVTGRKALFPSGTAFGAEGLERDEGRALIAELREHITQPAFVTSYKVRQDDIFLWDNYQTLHTATPIEYSDEEGKRRLLYRISTKGIPDLCRRREAA
ncbi:MAG: TauD/TfdA family dioxygenase [Rhodospirillales bacterium]